MDKGPWPDHRCEDAGVGNPQFGSVYTIEEIVAGGFVGNDCDVLLGLCGLDEHYFVASCFRPVAKRSSESGVNALKKHLKAAPVSAIIARPDFAKAGDL